MRHISNIKNKLTPRKVKRTFYTEDGKAYFDYILTEDVPSQYRDEFFKWLYGQTIPVVFNQATGKEETAAYWHDWERWYKYKTGKAKFLVFD